MASTLSRTCSALALAAAVAVAPLAAIAAPGGWSDGGAQHGQKMQRAHGMQGGWGKRMMHKLDLTQAQRDQIFKIRHDQAQAMYDQHKAVRAAQKSLRQLTTADTFDEAAARQASDTLGQAQARLALTRAETQARIRAVLTPEQRQKLSQHAKGWRHHARQPQGSQS